VKNEVWHRDEENRNRPTYNKRMKANWVVHIMHRKCILNNVFEGKKEGQE
jgi:hypothetical protein